MDCLVVNGGKPLSGSITVGGMKNAALPILFATILVEGRCVIENLPPISDVTTALEILRAMGAKIHMLNKTTMEIDTSVIRCGSAPYELARNMRASYYVLGAELGRFRQASAACPGGCDVGVRPIGPHGEGFESLGAKVSVVSGYVRCDASESGLKAANIYMDVVTVGATINIMLAAVKAQGQTVIENAAKEPHVVDLANFLNACGANIVGAARRDLRHHSRSDRGGHLYDGRCGHRQPADRFQRHPQAPRIHHRQVGGNGRRHRGA